MVPKVSQTNATMPRYEMHIPPARDEACGAVRSAHLLKTVPSRRLCVSSHHIAPLTRGPLEVVGGAKGVSNQCYHA